MSKGGETIKGAYLERLLFPKYPDPENRFFIGVFSQDDGSGNFGFGFDFTGKGAASEMEPGLTYTLTGKWEDNYYRGKKTRQFSFDMAVVEKPRDLGGIQIFLQKRLSGIGPAKSKSIIDAFGIDAIDILRDDPARVANDIPALAGLADSISDTLKKFDADDRILIELEKLFAGVKGLPRNLPQRCLDKWRADAVEKIRGNPYQLTEFSGIGFLLADQVGIHAIKIDPDSMDRKRAAVGYCLSEYQQSTGNTWIDQDILESKTKALIGCDARPGVEDMISLMELATNGDYITFAVDFQNEWSVADKLKNLMQDGSGRPGLVLCLDCFGIGCEICGWCGNVEEKSFDEGDI